MLDPAGNVDWLILSLLEAEGPRTFQQLSWHLNLLEKVDLMLGLRRLLNDHKIVREGLLFAIPARVPTRRNTRHNPPRKGPASPEGWKTGPHTGLYWHGVADPDIYADLVAGRRKLSLQTGWASDPGDLGWGIYLTSLRREAVAYGKVLKVRCVLRNALFVPNPRAWFEQMTEMTGGNPVRGSMRKLMAYDDAEEPYYGAELKADKKHYADLWTKLFLSKGIDGLVVKGWDLGGPVVVFEPETALSIV